MNQQKNKWLSPLLFYGAIIVLFAYTFRNVDQGIDVTDTGYHFSNFLYVNKMDPMWIFSTYLTSKLGHLFTLLPGGQTLLGINIYTSFIPAILGVITFVFFTKTVKIGLLDSFVGTLVSLALCWCPTTCVYNYLTFLLFTMGAIFLYIALCFQRKTYLVFAGVCLGLNVLVRFPNVAEAALILAVWYTCFLRKEKFSVYVSQTAYCLSGYVLGMAAVFAQIAVQYGLDEYINGIIRLLGMTSDASEYTLYSMVYNLIQAYIFSGKWVLIIGLCIMLGVLGYMILPGRYTMIKNIGYGACCLVLIRWFYGQGMFSLAYDGYGAILNWGSVAIISTLILCGIQIVSPNVPQADKILSAIVIIVIGITPLGSNNQMYANLNNMFLAVPFLLYMLRKFSKGSVLKKIRVGRYSLEIFKNPAIIMCTVCLVMLIWQSLQFGNVFIFRDGIPRNSEVTSLPAVAGMQTNEENANNLQELGEYVSEHDLTGRNVLLFGDVPALSAYLKMPFIMSPWPDLPSYSNNTFKAELQETLQNIENNRPIILLGAKFYDFITYKIEDSDVQQSFEKKYGFKLDLIRDMIEAYEYVCTFENNAFIILE